jgi:hypothetical protein
VFGYVEVAAAERVQFAGDDTAEDRSF